ncbi:MAG: hypothetical protein GWM87_05575, partial [Xanthomonadales bacterium]|nr:sulfotransferase [Xanthomonadales bacterium]NIX12452.1 hypothetical protein [Xanthomonadales bacterium]
MFAAHPAVGTTGGLTYLDRIALDLERSGGYVPRLAGLTDSDARMYRQRYLDDASRHLSDGATVLVEQSPINFMHLGLVCRLLPEAVVIDVRRD